MRVSATSQHSPERRVLIGRVVGVFGVRGELKLESYTEPTGALLRYQPWIFVHNAVESSLAGVRGRDNARGVVATLPGITDRDAAQTLVGGRQDGVRVTHNDPPCTEKTTSKLHQLYTSLASGVKVV